MKPSGTPGSIYPPGSSIRPEYVKKYKRLVPASKVSWNRAAMTRAEDQGHSSKTRYQPAAPSRMRPDVRRGGRGADTAHYPSAIQPAG